MFTLALTVLEVLLIGVLALIGLAVLVFIGAILTAGVVSTYTTRRDLRFLSSFPCPKCEHVIGRTAVLAAREEYEDKRREAAKRHPRLGIVAKLCVRLAEPKWEIVCPSCGFKFIYHSWTSTIEIPGDSNPAA